MSRIEHVADRDTPRLEPLIPQPRVPEAGGAAKVGLQDGEPAGGEILRQPVKTPMVPGGGAAMRQYDCGETFGIILAWRQGEITGNHRAIRSRITDLLDLGEFDTLKFVPGDEKCPQFHGRTIQHIEHARIVVTSGE